MNVLPPLTREREHHPQATVHYCVEFDLVAEFRSDPALVDVWIAGSSSKMQPRERVCNRRVGEKCVGLGKTGVPERNIKDVNTARYQSCTHIQRVRKI